MRRLLAVGASIAVCSLLGACTDGTPPFCEPLRASAPLDGLADAIAEGDLAVARAEATRLSDLAATAPSELRADLEELAAAVGEIVDLLAAEADVAAAPEDAAEATRPPADVIRQREELNRRAGELDQRSRRVSDWARRECGLEL